MRPSKAKWQSTLEAALGAGYVCVASQTLVAIHVAVFVRTPLLRLVSGVQTAHAGTGVGKSLGNKGGVAVAMRIGRTSLLFVNAHLAAHQHKVAERNADFHRINNLSSDSDDGAAASASAEPSYSLASTEQPVAAASSAGHAASDFFDVTFWFGDLNYRVNGNREAIDALLAPASERERESETWRGDAAHWEQMRAVLLANDQLRLAMEKQQAFNGFREGQVTFRPTYKFDKKQHHLYDLSEKRRIPAYTDRVLWHDKARNNANASAGSPGTDDGAGSVRLLRYDSVEALCTSDHKPVVAEFDVTLHGVSIPGSADGDETWRIRPRHALARSGSSASLVTNPRGPAANSKSAAQSSICAVM